VDEIGCTQLCEEGGNHVTEEDDAFGYAWSDKVEGGGEDDYVEDVVDESCCC
jgi:hypothetical protein